MINCSKKPPQSTKNLITLSLSLTLYELVLFSTSCESVKMCELALPKHLNTELLENALKNAFPGKSVKVINFYTKPAVASGDNYTSDVFRVLVDFQIENFEPKQIGLIVKYMLETDGIFEFHNDFKFFVKEKEIYSNILPRISKMLNEDFAPKCHYIMDKPSKVFVMEDLKDSGLIVLDRQAGLDLEHCKLVVTKLAKFHASSMIIAQNNPELMKSFDFGLINKNTKVGEILPPYFTAGLATLIEEAQSWPNFESIVGKLKKIQVNLTERSIKCIDQDSSFKVLNHGDLWTNNFMIKYENKMPVDVLFVKI